MVIDEYEAIAVVIQLFMDGASIPDKKKLEQAFHKDARLIGTGYDEHGAAAPYNLTRAEFIGDYMKPPTKDANKHYRGKLVSVQMYGPDTAVAVVAEDHFWGHESYIDILSLWKEQGKDWKIVNKVFTQAKPRPTPKPEAAKARSRKGGQA
jgi:hypothetical protein